MRQRDQKKHIVRCYDCCKAIIGRFPKGGDGTMMIPRIHMNKGSVCLGSYSEAHLIRSKSELLLSEEKRYKDYLI